MKIKRFNENLEEYKSNLKKDLMKILDQELYSVNSNEIATDGKRCAIEEIINYLEEEGLLLALDSKKYNL